MMKKIKSIIVLAAFIATCGITYSDAIEFKRVNSEEEKKDPNIMAFAWVVDFPLFEIDGETNKLTFAHNPFSAPKAEHVEKLMKGEDLGALRAQQYDLVGNGCIA